jgi:hypothetical protein
MSGHLALLVNHAGPITVEPSEQLAPGTTACSGRRSRRRVPRALVAIPPYNTPKPCKEHSHAGPNGLGRRRAEPDEAASSEPIRGPAAAAWRGAACEPES